MASIKTTMTVLVKSRLVVIRSLSNPSMMRLPVSKISRRSLQQRRNNSTANSTSKQGGASNGANKKEYVTIWPLSLSDFVAGTPIVTKSMPYFGRISIDFGTVMMNFGAITSLSGFCMTDVLFLRTLSIVGSLCGVTYNITRVPKQLNAVAWGGIFVAVNVVQIGRLMIERREVKFSVEEGELYYRVFAPFHVDPKLFAKLVHKAQWKTYKKGQVIVSNGKPLTRVHLLVQGSATCRSGTDESKLYTYSATDNGCIIGATAVVDPTILGRSYPNQIIAEERVRALSFDAHELRQFLKDNESTAEAAFLHLMYVDLLGALRRDRRLGEALQKLKILLEEQCSSTSVVAPQGRRAVREFLEQNKITELQFKSMLQSVGWTEREWKDGAKHSSQIYDASST